LCPSSVLFITNRAGWDPPCPLAGPCPALLKRSLADHIQMYVPSRWSGKGQYIKSRVRARWVDVISVAKKISAPCIFAPHRIPCGGALFQRPAHPAPQRPCQPCPLSLSRSLGLSLTAHLPTYSRPTQMRARCIPLSPSLCLLAASFLCDAIAPSRRKNEGENTS
jgi:hypothetical protein